jgi:hypothetical protein
LKDLRKRWSERLDKRIDLSGNRKWMILGLFACLTMVAVIFGMWKFVPAPKSMVEAVPEFPAAISAAVDWIVVTLMVGSTAWFVGFVIVAAWGFWRHPASNDKDIQIRLGKSAAWPIVALALVVLLPSMLIEQWHKWRDRKKAMARKTAESGKPIGEDTDNGFPKEG